MFVSNSSSSNHKICTKKKARAHHLTHYFPEGDELPTALILFSFFKKTNKKYEISETFSFYSHKFFFLYRTFGTFSPQMKTLNK